MSRRNNGTSVRRHYGFTLIEILVTVVFVAIAITGVMGGMSALSKADSKALKAELLQRLASQKMKEIQSVTAVNTAPTSGDFSELGYPAVSWTLEVTSSAVTNLYSASVTAVQGADSQSLTGLVYVQPTTVTATQ